MEVETNDLLQMLSRVVDPEIPVLNIVEMGIVRDAAVQDGTLVVSITPTYSGCPAMRAIEDAIVSAMKAEGFEDVRVRTSYREPWTTDWMTDEARRKLKAYGIAPPELGGSTTTAGTRPVPCPHCDSTDTELRSFFGSTACKALHYCNACEQPFEEFKCI